jgi:hypothetical protein
MNIYGRDTRRHGAPEVRIQGSPEEKRQDWPEARIQGWPEEKRQDWPEAKIQGWPEEKECWRFERVRILYRCKGLNSSYFLPSLCSFHNYVQEGVLTLTRTLCRDVLTHQTEKRLLITRCEVILQENTCFHACIKKTLSKFLNKHACYILFVTYKVDNFPCRTLAVMLMGLMSSTHV